MLILHPSSRCDVCLDAYTWQSIAQTPHAIPCGHIFCRPCLFALGPSYLCPLCRKKFEPSKAKKLHVDRPECVDENKENDLLQRLAVSWEAPEDELKELMHEVDTWLHTRADDTCSVLRKTRVALTTHVDLKKAEMTLQNALTDIHTRYKDLVIAYDADHRTAVATETKLKEDYDALMRMNEDLKAELRIASEQHHYSKNPLPLPPKPISTEHVPSFAQAIAHERVRFDLPLSPPPTGSSYTPSFEVESRKRNKGKTRSVEHQVISPTHQKPHPLPTQLAKMDPSVEAPALISHFDYHNPHQRRTSTPAPSSGLKLHFENTNQPLDVFELTHTYLREYSQGVLDGRLMGGKPASRPLTSQRQQSHASTSRNLLVPDNNESIDARSVRSTQETQSVSSRSSRPLHQRQQTIAISVESSPPGRSSEDRSRSRSISRRNHISNPSLADLLSDSTTSPPPHRPTSPPNPSSNFSIPSFPQPSHVQQPGPSLIRPSLARAQSPAPSQSSKTSSWGTIVSTSTNLTSYSLLGLRDFREGSYPRTVGSDGANTSWASPVSSVVGGRNATSPRTHGSRTNSQRSSQYPPPPPSLSSWHGSVASLSPAPQDRFSFSNGYHSDDEDNDNLVRSDGLLNPSYSRDSTGSRPRAMESFQRMTRGRIQPLPAVSPSFLFRESIIIAEEDDRLNQTSVETFGNALGLELTTGPTPISAPTPIVPHRTFLRSFSDVDEA